MTGLIETLLPWALGVLAVVGVLFGYGARQKAQGRQDAATDALKDAMGRQERGRNAVSDIRGADRDGLVDSVRRNNRRW